MRKKTEVEMNPALINAIAPIGMKISRNQFEIGENIGKGYVIIRYPSEPDYGWFSQLSTIPGTMFSYTFRQIDNGNFLEALNKNIGHQRGLERDARDTRTKQRAKKAADDGENLLLQIDQYSEAVGLLSTVLVPLAQEQETLTKVSRKTTSSCLIAKCKPRLLANLQEQAIKQASPMYTLNDDILKTAEKVVPLSAVMGGFANTSQGYNDGKGYLFAKDASGGLVVLDLWLRGDDRTNTNMTITGESGQGKSTQIKNIALSEYMTGTKIIFVDPEREYKELCQNLNGDWINTAGGMGRINPLEIQPVPRDDEEEEAERLYKDNGHGMGDMSLYLQHLQTFFSIYIPSLTDMHKAVLEDVLIELYNNFHIDWNTDIRKLKPADFPVFTDLYDLLRRKAEQKESIRKQTDVNYYEELAQLIKNAAHGSLAGLWNGHTTIHADSRCICLDTKDLQDVSDNVKRAQYFILNSWLWKIMSRDRTEKVLTIYDEAYLVIDPKVPQTLGFLRNVSKRARKYETGLVIISQSIVDFLDEKVRMYGQALLDNASYKLFFGTDGENLEQMKKIFKLTEAEEELLEKKRRKHALLIIGSKRLHVVCDIPDYKFQYFGSAGGR